MRIEGVSVLLEDAPEFHYANGMFYASDPSGTRAIRPHAFFKGFQRMAKAIQDYHSATGAEVVELRPVHAASS